MENFIVLLMHFHEVVLHSLAGIGGKTGILSLAFAIVSILGVVLVELILSLIL